MLCYPTLYHCWYLKVDEPLLDGIHYILIAVLTGM